MCFLDFKHFLVFFRFFRLFLLHLFALLLNHLFRSTTKNTRILDTSYSCFFLFPMHFFTHLLILSLPNFCIQLRKNEFLLQYPKAPVKGRDISFRWIANARGGRRKEISPPLTTIPLAIPSRIRKMLQLSKKRKIKSEK